MKLPTMSQLRNWAHDLLAILGAIALSQAAIVAFLAQVGVTKFDTINYGFAILGAVVLALSKLVDSANNAVVTRAQIQAANVPPSPPPAP